MKNLLTLAILLSITGTTLAQHGGFAGCFHGVSVGYHPVSAGYYPVTRATHPVSNDTGTSAPVGRVVGHSSVIPNRSDEDDRTMICTLFAVVGIVGAAFLGAVVLGQPARGQTIKRIVITETPPGEAPDEVRRAWVGLKLPVAPDGVAPMHIPVRGVRTGARMGSGAVYPVVARRAIEILQTKNRDAARWWTKNVPHIFDSSYRLFFPTSVCEEIT